MDSREPPPPQPPPAGSQQLHPHHQHQLQQHMISPYASSMINHNHASAGNPNPSSGGGFPFNSVGPHALQPPPPRPQPKQQPADGGVFDGSSPPSSGMGFSIEPTKKKRGRPRKYTPDGNIALGLSPTGISPSGGPALLGLSPTGISPSGGPALLGYGDSGGGGGGGTPGDSSEAAPKRNRGRPPGSGKKQLDALGGVGGVGFTPHVITVNAGEDVASKIMAFSQQGPRTVCILSANGAICNVTLKQPGNSSGTVSYEGRYEIISLSGTFFFSQESGQRRTGGLSVSLASAEGRVMGGAVAGMLTAASTVLVVVGSFVADGKKSSSSAAKSGPSAAPGSQMLNFGAPSTAASPPSQGGGSSESSDDNGSSPPANRTAGFYGNSGPAMHNMPMYQLWGGPNPQ